MKPRYEIDLTSPVPIPDVENAFVQSVTRDDLDSLARLMLDAYVGTIDYEGEDSEGAVDEVRSYLDRGPLMQHSLCCRARWGDRFGGAGITFGQHAVHRVRDDPSGAQGRRFGPIGDHLVNVEPGGRWPQEHRFVYHRGQQAFRSSLQERWGRTDSRSIAGGIRGSLCRGAGQIRPRPASRSSIPSTSRLSEAT